ncbi:MAG: hypothetical protein KC420_23165, partial [Myxococcales bacterium]|nr:hypothetical protein [Myxococcales bacterium]
ELDPSQRAKYDIFVAQIIADLKKGSATNILGFLARLSLVALHAEADEGYSWANAEGGVARRNVSPNALPHYEQRGWTLATSSGSELAVERSLPPPDPNSPKFVAIARRVAAQPTCGHIIFCEPTAVHQWMREVLVAHGIPRARIAILNADTPTAVRTQIAREFNGLSAEPPAPGTCARPTDT